MARISSTDAESACADFVADSETGGGDSPEPHAAMISDVRRTKHRVWEDIILYLEAEKPRPTVPYAPGEAHMAVRQATNGNGFVYKSSFSKNAPPLPNK